MRQKKSREWNSPDKSTLIMAFFAASAFFMLFLSVMSVPQRPVHENLHYGMLNTTESLEFENMTRIKVYYSELCPACSKEFPILEELAINGTLIELIDVNEEVGAAQRDGVFATPTIFVINGPYYLRFDSYVEGEELSDAVKKVRDKSKLIEDSYGS